MPTYQYACTECNDELEAVQKFADDPLTQCPSCSGKLRKVFSAVGVVFKGSGFYRTDSRAKSSAAEGPGKSGSAEKSTTSEAAKTDSAGSSSPSSSSSSSASKDTAGRTPKKSGGESAA